MRNRSIVRDTALTRSASCGWDSADLEKSPLVRRACVPRSNRLATTGDDEPGDSGKQDQPVRDLVDAKTQHVCGWIYSEPFDPESTEGVQSNVGTGSKKGLPGLVACGYIVLTLRRCVVVIV